MFNVCFDIEVSDPSNPLKLLVKTNNNIILDTDTDRKLYCINCEFSNKENLTHTINIKLSGKNNSHTQLSENGEIISSAQIKISNLLVDNLDISDIISCNTNIARYIHNSNEPGEHKIHYFDPVMGFNGNVEFVFKTPLHPWLFDNL